MLKGSVVCKIVNYYFHISSPLQRYTICLIRRSVFELWSFCRTPKLQAEKKCPFIYYDACFLWGLSTDIFKKKRDLVCYSFLNSMVHLSYQNTNLL